MHTLKYLQLCFRYLTWRLIYTIKCLHLCFKHIFWYLISVVKYFEYELWVLYLLTHTPILITVFSGQISRIKRLDKFGRRLEEVADQFAESLSNSRFFEKRLKKILVCIAEYVSSHGLLGKSGKKIKELAIDIKEGAVEMIGLSIPIFLIYNATLGLAIYDMLKRIFLWFISQF